MKFYGNYGEHKSGTLDGTVPMYRGKLITDAPDIVGRSWWLQTAEEYPPEKRKPRGFTGKKVMCLATGEIYPSIRAAARAAYTSECTMSIWCRKGKGWVRTDNAKPAQT